MQLSKFWWSSRCYSYSDFWACKFLFFPECLPSSRRRGVGLRGCHVDWLIATFFQHHPPWLLFRRPVVAEDDEGAAAVDVGEALVVGVQLGEVAAEDELEQLGLQSWALEVFFNFFNNKKWFFAFFIKLITYFCTSPIKKKNHSQSNYLDKNIKNHLLLLKKLKNTSSAQLWLGDIDVKWMYWVQSWAFGVCGSAVQFKLLLPG